MAAYVALLMGLIAYKNLGVDPVGIVVIVFCL
jgi:hypothetical protein